MADIGLSVVLCNRSDGHWLKRSLPPLARELGGADQIVFVDDGSEDDSLAIARAILPADERVSVIENGRSLGVIEAGRIGFAHARGAYVAWLSADDEVRPGLFARVRAAARAWPAAGVIGSETTVERTQSDGPPSRYAFAAGLANRWLSPAELSSELRSAYVWIASSGAFLRRESLAAIGGWDPGLGQFSDWYAVYALAAAHGCVLLDIEGSLLRVRPDSFGARANRDRSFRDAAIARLFELLCRPENAVLRRFLARGALALPYALGPAMFAEAALWRTAPALMAEIFAVYAAHRVRTKLATLRGAPPPFGARA